MWVHNFPVSFLKMDSAVAVCTLCRRNSRFQFKTRFLIIIFQHRPMTLYVPKCTCIHTHAVRVCVLCAHLTFSTSICAAQQQCRCCCCCCGRYVRNIDVHSNAKLRHQIVQVRQCILQSTRTFHSFAHLCVDVVVVVVAAAAVVKWVQWIGFCGAKWQCVLCCACFCLLFGNT